MSSSTKKFGIYNTCARAFQFGICESTPRLAMKRLFQKIGKDAYKWRFVPKELPSSSEVLGAYRTSRNRHGVWKQWSFDVFECSVCGFLYKSCAKIPAECEANFCPRCGSLMGSASNG